MGERGLWTVLGEIPDRGGRKGRRYPLRSLLGIPLAAMLAGANDLRAIFRWGRRLRPEALAAFGITNGKAPCHAAHHYFFASPDGDAVAGAVGRRAADDGPPGHIALDGKTPRGSRRDDAKGLHVLSACATALSAVAGDVVGDPVVEPDANEITAAVELLKDPPLEGAAITGGDHRRRSQAARSSHNARSAGISVRAAAIASSP